MNDRMATLVGALAALFIAAGLFLSRGAGQAETPSRPLSQDTGDYGMAGMARWLQQSGIDVLAMRERYSGLPGRSPAHNGNLLVVSEPAVYPPRPGELHTLRNWIQRGNDILILESMAESPEWAMAGRGSSSNDTLLTALGLKTSKAPDGQDGVCAGTTSAAEADRAAAAPVALKPHPTDVDAPLLQGVREVRIKPEATPTRVAKMAGLGFIDGNARESFEWLCDTPRGRNALWQFRLGKGRVWVSTYPQLFANRNLALADNARLLANVVSLSVTGDTANRGAVIFDDMHQGDSTLYDPAAFFGDSRLHASLWLLLAIWLLYLLGYSNRFAPPLPPRSGITPARFVENLGGFFARHLSPSATADALLRRLQIDLARRSGHAASTATLAQSLASTPGIAEPLSKRLHDAERDLRSGRDRDLRPLARAIHNIREQLK